MTWREIVTAIANAARHREGNVANPPPNSPQSEETRGFAKGAAYAFNVMAEEMEYLTKMPSHEALQHVRKLAALPRKKGQS